MQKQRKSSLKKELERDRAHIKKKAEKDRERAHIKTEAERERESAHIKKSAEHYHLKERIAWRWFLCVP